MKNHVAQQGAHIVSHGLVGAMQVEANKRGHGNRTALTGALGGLGLVVGSFTGIGAVLLLGGLGAIVGYGVGESIDKSRSGDR